MKIYEFRLKFHWSLFLRVQLTYSSIDSDNGLATTRRQAIIWTNDCISYWHICLTRPQWVHTSENVSYLQFQQRQHWVSQASHHGFHILQHVCLEVWLRNGVTVQNVFQVVTSTLVYLVELLAVNRLLFRRLRQTTCEESSLQGN